MSAESVPLSPAASQVLSAILTGADVTRKQQLVNTNGYWKRSLAGVQAKYPPVVLLLQGAKITTKVVGVSYGNRQSVIAELKFGDPLFLIREV